MHGDINLIMSRYTHIFWGQESEAVARLPDLSLPSKGKQKAVETRTEDAKNLAQNLALLDGKPRTSLDFDGQKPEKEIYSSTLKKTLFMAKTADFAAKTQTPKKTFGE